MEQIIRLTESDIRNIILDVVNEYYVNEGKLHNAVVASGLALTTLGGSVLSNKMAHTDFDFSTPNIPTVGHSMRLTPTNNTEQNTPKFGEPEQNQLERKAKVINYYPSEELINFIKKYETFHYGWVDDGAGNLSTGWGFKETPELRRMYPNGMHTKEEADAYLKKYIDDNISDFKSMTPNIDELPQEIGDALFDVYYNVGSKIYKNSPNLQKSLKQKNIKGIIQNLEYGRMNGHKKRSSDRKNIATRGDYTRNY